MHGVSTVSNACEQGLIFCCPDLLTDQGIMDESQSLFSQADAAVNGALENPSQEELAETVLGLLSHFSNLASEIVSGMYRRR